MPKQPHLRIVPPTDNDQVRKVSSRWTSALAKTGFTPIVNVFLENYASLQPPMTTTEAMLVVHLMLHKWDESPPFPAFKTLAKRMGISTTQARNHARSLESKKYVRRIKRIGQPNLFDLTPLFAALEKKAAQVAEKKSAVKMAKAV